MASAHHSKALKKNPFIWCSIAGLAKQGILLSFMSGVSVDLLTLYKKSDIFSRVKSQTEDADNENKVPDADVLGEK